MNQSITLSSTSQPEVPNQDIIASGSFRQFLQQKGVLLLLCIAGIAIFIQFIIFKQFYPFPDFFSDSYSYLFAAYARLDVSIWPIGYSKFLLWFHYLTYSSTALIAFQYFLLELGAGYFFFSFLFLYRPSKVARILLFIFLFFNPLFLYISNYVNSDPLFAALSFFWFTQLLWILHKPKIYQLFVQAVLLFLCFSVRNNAYYYPIIAAIAFLLSRQNWKMKVSGILLPFVFIIPFVTHTRNVAYQMTGAHQYSLFTGWQLANNALYMRGHIEVDSTKLPSSGARMLNRVADEYFINRAPEFDDFLTAYVANYFVRQSNAPLKLFFSAYFHPKDEFESIVDWGRASIIFGQYGSYLIKHYPIEFAQYYLWRNTKNYFLPPLEKLEVYNLGTKEVEPIAQYWFHFNSRSVVAASQVVQGKILYLYPAFFFFINLYFLINLYWWYPNHKLRKFKKEYTSLVILMSCFWAINLGFSVFATINVFRYQFFPMILCVSSSLILTSLLETTVSKSSILPEYARQ